jgi:hypothetical protein
MPLVEAAGGIFTNREAAEVATTCRQVWSPIQDKHTSESEEVVTQVGWARRKRAKTPKNVARLLQNKGAAVEPISNQQDPLYSLLWNRRGLLLSLSALDIQRQTSLLVRFCIRDHRSCGFATSPGATLSLTLFPDCLSLTHSLCLSLLLCLALSVLYLCF